MLLGINKAATLDYCIKTLIFVLRNKKTNIVKKQPDGAVLKWLKLLSALSGADGVDSSPVIKASQEKRTRH